VPSPTIATGSGYPPGHYYSPIPSLADAVEAVSRARVISAAGIPGVAIDLEAQIALSKELDDLQRDLLPELEGPGCRYQSKNGFFSAYDAFALRGLMLKLEPRLVIEAGSGWSSAAMLDLADARLPDTRFTFVDPEPDRLLGLLRENDTRSGRVEVLRHGVQDVPLERFEELGDRDILFIDSSHVSKAGSDVNFLLLEVVPRLAPGVFVHVHDVFWPFEYHESWFQEGRWWNEAYILRALLIDNRRLRVAWWGSPLCAQPAMYPIVERTDTDGGSIWLEVLDGSG